MKKVKANEIKSIRESIFLEQSGLDAITKEPISPSDCVLDHCHESNLCRAVLHRQTNVYLGKIENGYGRYMYWSDVPLPTLLRSMADYIERGGDGRYLHPEWKKTLRTKFKSLREADKDKLLRRFHQPCGKNHKERMKYFNALLLTPDVEYDKVLNVIDKLKESK